eukprot:g2403.t1
MHIDDPEISAAQIAEKLGKSTKTVKNYISNAKKKLVQNQKKQEIQIVKIGRGASSDDPTEGGNKINKDKRAEADCVVTPCYTIAEVPGQNKGRGLIATRDIKRGELIIAEKPVLFAPGTTGFSAVLARKSWEERLQRDFLRLPAERQRDVMQLHDKAAGAGGADKTTKTLAGIFATNGLPQGVGSTDGVLCLTISRANHSCCNNAYHAWNATDGTERLYAEDNIACGDEICTNYCSAWTHSRAERRAELQAKFYFHCMCAECTLPEEEVAKRDAIRGKIRDLDEIIPTYGATNPAKGVSAVEKMFDLYTKLGQPIPWSMERRGSYDAFQLSLSSSSQKNIMAAKRWARRAWLAGCVAEGEKATATLKYKRYMENPMSKLAERFGG